MINRQIFVTKKLLCQILFQTVEQLMSYIEKSVLLTGGFRSFVQYIRKIVSLSCK